MQIYRAYKECAHVSARQYMSVVVSMTTIDHKPYIPAWCAQIVPRAACTARCTYCTYCTPSLPHNMPRFGRGGDKFEHCVFSDNFMSIDII